MQSHSRAALWSASRQGLFPTRAGSGREVAGCVRFALGRGGESREEAHGKCPPKRHIRINCAENADRIPGYTCCTRFQKLCLIQFAIRSRQEHCFVLIHTSCKTSCEAFKMQCSMPTTGMAAAPVFILGKPRIKVDRLWGLLGMISLKELAFANQYNLASYRIRRMVQVL